MSATKPVSKVRDGYVRPVDFKHGRVDMTHGGGGRAMAQLIDELFAARVRQRVAARRATTRRASPVPAGRLVMATDSHVVSPLFFPGGDIGCLSVHGTINDVAMAGARPLYLAAGFILEEGFPLADLKRIVESMARAAREAGVPIVTGDTKVVEHGKGDGVFITTTGVGVVPPGVDISGDRARPGRRDPRQRHARRPRRGDHVAAREPGLRDDDRVGHRRAARPGRGDGRGGAGHPLPARPDARRPRDDAERDRAAVGLRHADRRGAPSRCRPRSRRPASSSASTRSTSPTRASWSRSVPPPTPSALLAAMRAHPLGRDAAIIGEVIDDPHHFVQMETALRRPAHRRLADRRAAAAHLLSSGVDAHPVPHPRFNSLTQRLYVELAALGHEVSVEFDINDARDARGGGAVPARADRRAVPEARDSRSRSGARTAASSSTRASSAIAGRRRSTGRSWTASASGASRCCRPNAEMDAGDVWASVDVPDARGDQVRASTATR